MKINDLKGLKKLIQLCQSQGVKAIEIDGIKLELNDRPVYTQSTKKYKQVDPSVNFPPTVDEDIQIPQMDIDMPDELTEEQLLFYSSPTTQTENPS